jgi:lipopolysaccharide/colanic/teichoic acid biosynthesis glycosyltransferase
MTMKARIVPAGILVADLCWIPAAMVLAWVFRYGVSGELLSRQTLQIAAPVVAVTWFLWILGSSSMKLGGLHDGWWFPAVASRIFLAVCGVFAALLASGYLARWYISRLALAYFALTLLIGCLAIRYVVRAIIRVRYRRGSVRRVAIVGNDRVALEVADKIKRHPEMLWKVVGFFVPEEYARNDSVINANSPGTLVTVSSLGVLDVLQVEKVEELIVTMAGPFKMEVLNLLGRCRKLGIQVSFVPQPYELYLSRPQILDLGGVPLLELNEASGGATQVWKRALDLSLGSILVLLAVPVLLPCVGLLYWHKKQAFVWDTRCGRLGKPFSMLRLNVRRHMTDGSWIERVLENLSLTELPQLWNVMRGEMSLVGPRPEPPDRVKHYSDWQQQRLSVVPGIVGLAQVHGLREQNSSEEKTRFDLQYLLNLSPLTDLSLLLQTIWTLIVRLVRSLAISRPQRDVRNVIIEQTRNEVVEGNGMEGALDSAYRSKSGAD